MHEESKLREAAYFYTKVCSVSDDRDNLMFDLSAFLSAARSVLQYAFREATVKAGGQLWYDGHVASTPVLCFFKDKRDINIHVQPVQVSQHTAIHLTDVLRFSESINVKKFNESGNLIGEYSSTPPKSTAPPEKPHEVSHRFTFRDWPGSEDVIQLCDAYLKELHRIVADGQSRGFLSK